MDHEEEVLRGRQAAELLEHPLIVEAFAALEKEVMDAWKASPARDEAGREKLWLMLHLSQKVKGHLESLVVTGKMGQIRLKELNKQTLLQKVGLVA